jgi:predicted RNA binding protein YcfA (HicA-like mRNA interferase family)
LKSSHGRAIGWLQPSDAEMADYYRDLIRLLKDSGYELKRKGRGDHEIWWNPRSGIHVTVDRKLGSSKRHPQGSQPAESILKW